MKYLLVVAHGSRRAESNDEVRELAAKLDKMEHGYDEVGAAFLELAEPLIPDGIISAIEKGADEVVVFPYFLSAGRGKSAVEPPWGREKTVTAAAIAMVVATCEVTPLSAMDLAIARMPTAAGGRVREVAAAFASRES